MNSLYKGKILISTPDVSGDIFSRAVVLIIEHNEEGAFGLILNKKNELISNKFSQLFDFKTNVYDGGPVSKERLFFIINANDSTQPDFYHPINERFYITENSESIISDVISEKLAPEDIKIFSGYSGWDAGQLEQEIYYKLWNIIDLPDMDYITPDSDNLWKKLMQNLGGEHLIWANTPADIGQN